MNKALLVGVNKYKNVTSLRGCVNDVVDMHRLLKNQLGFTSSQIRVVTDERATKKNILARLEWLVKGAVGGDHLIFHFSGHGSQVRDRDGDELDDHLDELLCPHDMDWDGTYITDDDLGQLFNVLPSGVLLEVFLDCCHSGTGLRDLQILNRHVDPPIDIQLRSSGDALTSDKVVSGRKTQFYGQDVSQIRPVLMH